MTRTQTARQRRELAEWRDAIVSNVGTEATPTARHGDRAPDDLGSMRAIIWCGVIAALLMVSSCVIKTRLTLAHAQAPQAHLIAHGLSWHNHNTHKGKHYNERNDGAGLRVDLGALAPDTSVQIGRYRNSYRQHSTYAIADWTPLAWGPLQAGAFAGLVTGYPMTDGRAMPAAGLIARATWRRISTAVRVAPGKDSNLVAALELGVRL